MTASNPLCFPFACPHCLARWFELLLMFIPPPGWKWQPTRVQQAVLHRQNPREHYCWWVTLYIWGYSLVARMHFLDCTTNTALKHSKQLKQCVQHIQSPLTWIALLLAYSTNSFAFLGVCFLCFCFICFLWPLLSYLFWFCIMFLNAQPECRILTIPGKITGCYIHSHACIQKTLLSQTID